MRVWGILILLCLFITACTVEEIQDSATSRVIAKTPLAVEQPPPEPSDYVVIVNQRSLFLDDAKRFAEHYDAEVLTYRFHFSEILPQLQTIKPEYLVWASVPHDLHPDYVGELDDMLKTIDDDPYLDVAYGILTSRTPELFSSYVDRLIAYQPTEAIDLYGLGSHYDHYDAAFGITVEQDCVQESFRSVICEEEAATADIRDGFAGADVVIIDAHGYPGFVLLDGDARLKGTSEGLLATNGDEEELLLTKASLVMATSCLTGRIVGVPSEVIEGIEPVLTPARIENSALLSTLQNGANNYIAAIHPALNNMLPQEELAELSFVEGKPLGEVIKQFKNRLIYTTEHQLPGKELDEFTQRLLLFSAKTWVLFGDPAAQVSSHQYSFNEAALGQHKDAYLSTTPCVYNRIEQTTEQGKRIDLTLDGTNAFYYHDAQVKTFPKQEIQGLSKEPLCIFTVKKEDDQTIEFLTKELPYQDLGDEYLIAVESTTINEPTRIAFTLS